MDRGSVSSRSCCLTVIHTGFPSRRPPSESLSLSNEEEPVFPSQSSRRQTRPKPQSRPLRKSVQRRVAKLSPVRSRQTGSQARSLSSSHSPSTCLRDRPFLGCSRVEPVRRSISMSQPRRRRNCGDEPSADQTHAKGPASSRVTLRLYMIMNTAFRLTVRRTDLSAYSPPLGSAVERKRVGLNRFPDGHGYERCLLAPRFRRGSNTHSGC
jgi:hypothetical protein